MQHVYIRVRFRMPPIAMAAVVCLAGTAFAGQDYVTRFDAFGGYAFLDSPRIGLFENGFATQIGFRANTLISAGFDYSITSGDATLTPNLLTNTLQQQLGAQLLALATEGVIPPGYSLEMPVHSRTQTFAAGPQLSFRHFRQLTLFLRPIFFGGIHEVATLKPRDQIAAGVAMQLAPSGHLSDNTWFLGAGGGFDLLLSRHLAVRTQTDVVWDHLFSNVLANGRWTVRFSIGPAFNFGPNIKK